VNVGELRRALEGVDDELDIVVRAFDDDNDYCGTPFSVEVETGCSDEPFFAIDCCGSDDEDEDAIAEEAEAAPQAPKE